MSKKIVLYQPKNLPLYMGGGAVAVLIILFLLYPRSTRPVYKPCCSDSPQKTEHRIQKFKIYLETSNSMKGYVKPISNGEVGEYKMKELGLLIAKLAKIGKEKVDLYTISDRPTIYTSGVDDFNSNLIGGQIFKGSQSRLQNSICSIIDSIHDNVVSVFISDCILDLGNRADLPIATSTILNSINSSLKNQKNLSILTFQFLSDFNGRYYYNSENNTGSSGNPYSNSLMKKRPFYLWVFGNSSNLKSLVCDNIFGKDYTNSYSYNLNFNCCDVDFQILPYKQKGKMIIDSHNENIKFIDFSKDEDFSFTIGLDMSCLPPYAHGLDYLIDQKNLSILPDHLNQDRLLSFEINSRDKVIIDPNYSKLIPTVKKNLTHFITITLKTSNSINKAVIDYKLIIKQRSPAWVSSTHIDDDRNLSLEAIEGKTFGFKAITDAFERAYEDKENLLEISFKITSN